jgi:hypothetical protein
MCTLSDRPTFIDNYRSVNKPIGAHPAMTPSEPPLAFLIFITCIMVLTIVAFSGPAIYRQPIICPLLIVFCCLLACTLSFHHRLSEHEKTLEESETSIDNNSSHEADSSGTPRISRSTSLAELLTKEDNLKPNIWSRERIRNSCQISARQYGRE